MTLIVAGALVVTLAITVFAMTRGGRPSDPKPPARRPQDGDR